MAKGQSTEIISMIKWIRTSWLSIKNSLSVSSRMTSVGSPVKVLAMEELALPDFV